MGVEGWNTKFISKRPASKSQPSNYARHLDGCSSTPDGKKDGHHSDPAFVSVYIYCVTPEKGGIFCHLAYATRELLSLLKLQAQPSKPFNPQASDPLSNKAANTPESIGF